MLKIFTREFFSVGALFAGFGVCVFAISVLRRREGNRQFFVERKEVGEGSEAAGGGVVRAERRFRTSGNVVCVVTGVSVCAYVALLVLVLRMGG